ncbi:hypothetical protein TRFO_34176 [Tritrichomonas foetus]|uniref:Cache domain-containing protein n=1 Tax=Tritrichomonas foetus TaxID=1144522 RepID=A0A1J4JLT1_9EUKA|nr:hypothetical protein TRFO_34176 [Tritrichomonas foetus]|eukprot:OHS99367.1 hypothetical protein TRFO_34176 [Tritrichomonas foetus]
MSPLILSLSRSDSKVKKRKLSEARLVQRNVYQKFNARRSAGSIERYFIQLRSSRCDFAIYIIGTLLLLATIIGYTAFLPYSLNQFNSEIIHQTAVFRSKIVVQDISMIFQESVLLSSIISNFFDNPAVYQLSKDTAYETTRIFYHASTVKSSNILFFQVGLASGGLIGIELIEKDYLMFCEGSEFGESYLTSWIGDEKLLNSSYPYTNGDPVALFDSTSRIWYMNAIEKGEATWTDMFHGITSGNKYIPMILLSIPSTDESVYSAGLSLTEVINLFTSTFSTPNSRFALIYSSKNTGSIIAVTGNETGFDEYEGKIVSKSLTQLNDDIWRLVTQNPDFQQDKNFIYQVDGKVFAIFHDSIDPMTNEIWTLSSVICLSDIYGQFLHIDNQYYIIFIVFDILMIIFVCSFLTILSNCTSVKQKKILQQKNRKNKISHLKVIGVNAAISQLKQILLSHADNYVIFHKVEEILADLCRASNCFFYDANTIYLGIKNKSIMNKFIKTFGIPEGIGLTDEIPPFDIKPMYSSSNLPHIRKISTFSSYPNETITSSNLENVLKKRKLLTKIEEIENIPEMMVSIITEYNDSNPLIKREILKNIMKEYISSMPNELLSLLFDSIDLVNTLLNYRFKEIILNNDLLLSLLIAIVAWHVSMYNRCDQALPLANHYFHDHKKLFKVVSQEIMIKLYDGLIDHSHDIMSRWNCLTSLFSYYSDTVKLQRQIAIIKNSLRIVKNFECFPQMNSSEIISLLQLLFIAGNASFFFHFDKKTIAVAHSILKTNLSQNDDRFIGFLTCLNKYHISPLLRFFGESCGISSFKKKK